MQWAIVDHTGQIVPDTFADHHDAAWHRYIQVMGAVDKEDAVTKVFAAQRMGVSCECLKVQSEIGART